MQKTVSRCDKCKSSINACSETQNGIHSPNSYNNNKDEDLKSSKLKELELELAQTKLALVEAECRNQVNK